MRNHLSRVLWTALIVQMGALSVVLGRPRAKAAPSLGRSLAVGDTASIIAGVRADGSADTVAVGPSGTTLVLAFSSTCVYCEEVAPTWRAWLERPHPGITAVALANEDPQLAETYRVKHRWAVRLLAVPGAGAQSLELALTARTPWLYAFDASGRLVLMRHGADIHEIDSLLTTHSP